MAAWVETGFTQPPVLGGRRFRLICRSSFYSRFYRFTGHQHVMNTALDPLFLFFFLFFLRWKTSAVKYSYFSISRRNLREYILGEYFQEGGFSAGECQEKVRNKVLQPCATMTRRQLFQTWARYRKLYSRFDERSETVFVRRFEIFVKIIQPLFHRAIILARKPGTLENKRHDGTLYRFEIESKWNDV